MSKKLSKYIAAFDDFDNTLRYYVTFKLKKFESLFYKINTFFKKTTTCIGLQAEQILFPKVTSSCGKINLK